MENSVIRERKDDISILIINREKRRNAIDLSVVQGLIANLRSGCAENKAVLITGAGAAYSAGLDLAAIYEFKTLDESRRFFFSLKDLALNIVNCDKPVLAYVNGQAFGLGLEMLYLMDYVLAVPAAQFGVGGVRFGIIPPFTTSIGSFILGPLTVRKLLNNTQLVFNAEQMQAMGVVSEVVPDASKGLDYAISFVKNIINIPLETFIFMKKHNIKYILNSNINKIDEVLEKNAELVLTDIVKQRIKEFLKK